ncbi:hypothetical protein IV507_05115 [Acinetobacter nosocomialis]|uniref:hypothetical protein n=1 Tax=Acinetobacter nosocomialis TaxID=106654 RepID=UPI002F416BBE
MINYKILWSLTFFSLVGCSSVNVKNSPQKIIVYDSGLVSFGVSQFDKKEKLFFKNSKYYVSKYGYTVANTEEIINIRIPSNQIQKSVYLYSSYSRGLRSYCNYKKDDPNLNVFKIFLDWASQPKKIREERKFAVNTLISSFKCDQSSVPKTQPDWYVEVEQYSQEPILVSNANWTWPFNPLKNRTVALTKYDVTNLLNELNKYFRE